MNAYDVVRGLSNDKDEINEPPHAARLFACYLVRKHWWNGLANEFRAAVIAGEKYAAGESNDDNLHVAFQCACRAMPANANSDSPEYGASRCAMGGASRRAMGSDGEVAWFVVPHEHHMEVSFEEIDRFFGEGAALRLAEDKLLECIA